MSTTTTTNAPAIEMPRGVGYARASTASPAEMPKAIKRVWWDAYVPPAFITLILLFGNWQYGVLESPWKTVAAILTSIACEVVLGRLIAGKVPHLASAYISGISVGILVRSFYFWPYPLCAAISILSKYALRVGGRHIWNPSNFGVSTLLFLYPWAVVSLGQQWGNNLAPMVVIWALGFLITWRVKRFHMSLTYALSFTLFAWVRHAVTGQPFLTELAPITGPMYMLFTFFMVTDPKTTVKARWGQYVVVFCVAAVEAAIRLTGIYEGDGHHYASHAPYYALFLVGPIANVIEILATKTGAAPVASRPVAA